MLILLIFVEELNKLVPFFLKIHSNNFIIYVVNLKLVLYNFLIFMLSFELAKSQNSQKSSNSLNLYIKEEALNMLEVFLYRKLVLTLPLMSYLLNG